MDMRIEAAPMAADAGVVKAVVTTVSIPNYKVTLPVMAVASSSCPSIGGVSISAVAPDYIFEGGTALAAA